MQECWSVLIGAGVLRFVYICSDYILLIDKANLLHVYILLTHKANSLHVYILLTHKANSLHVFILLSSLHVYMYIHYMYIFWRKSRSNLVKFYWNF